MSIALNFYFFFTALILGILFHEFGHALRLWIIHKRPIKVTFEMVKPLVYTLKTGTSEDYDGLKGNLLSEVYWFGILAGAIPYIILFTREVPYFVVGCSFGLYIWGSIGDFKRIIKYGND